MHQLVRVHTPLEVDGQFQAVQIGLIAHIGNFPDFSRLNQFRDLVDDGFRGGGIGNLIDFYEIPLFDVAPLGPDPEGAAARLINLPHFLGVIEDFAAGGKIGSGQRFQQVALRVFDAGNGRLAHLPQIEPTDVAGHTNGDTHVGRYQHIGECSGQQGRLQHGVIIVIDKVHRVGVDIPEQLLTDGVQLGFRISGSGVGHIPGVDLAEVTLGVHKGMQQRLIASGQTDHGLINGRVAVGIQPHGLTHDIGRFGASAVQKPHFIHGIEELSVRGLEAVDFGDGTGDNHRHGIGHVVQLQGVTDGLFENFRMKPLYIGIHGVF